MKKWNNADMLRRKVKRRLRLTPRRGPGTLIVKDDFRQRIRKCFLCTDRRRISDRELSDYAELIKREISDGEM